MADVVSGIAGYGAIGLLWTWFCCLLAAVQLAEMKRRSALQAFIAYVLCPPAALLYYIGVPSLEPVEVIQHVPKPKRRWFGSVSTPPATDAPRMRTTPTFQQN